MRWHRSGAGAGAGAAAVFSVSADIAMPLLVPVSLPLLPSFVVDLFRRTE
jgi:hypothetical protein